MTIDARRVAFEGLVDHAPLFPPASLAPPDAVAAHAAARASTDRWLAARLVWPAATLDELLTLLPPDASPEAPWPISVLLASPEEAAALVPLAGGPLRAEQVEVRLVTLADVDRLQESLAAAGVPEVRTVFEIGLDGDWEPALARLAGGGGTAKVRTGGPTADAVPSPAALVGFVLACAAGRVPFKATAGLHHPFWRDGGGDGGPQHGFVALLAACAVARQPETPTEVVVACLTDDRSAFGVDEDGLRWRDIWVGAEELQATRRELFLGFGSCSFDEPALELRALGWLP